MASNLTIRPLNTGFIPTKPLQYHFHFSAEPYLKDVPNEKIPLPDYAFLVEGGDRLVLVDTGMSWTERANDYHHPGSWQDEGQDIGSMLRSVGYSCGDIDIVVLTHLHWDHSYYLEKFNDSRVLVHRREYEFAQHPIPLYYKSYEDPALGLEAPYKAEPVEGDELEVIPGIRILETFGHSPGHISVEVDCADGRNYICAGDSLFDLRNLDPIPELHYDIIPPGRFADVVATWNSVRKQKARVEDKHQILPAHDKTLPDRLAENPIIGGPMAPRAAIVGSWDTKREEMRFMFSRLAVSRLDPFYIDVSTLGTDPLDPGTGYSSDEIRRPRIAEWNALANSGRGGEDRFHGRCRGGVHQSSPPSPPGGSDQRDHLCRRTPEHRSRDLGHAAPPHRDPQGDGDHGGHRATGIPARHREQGHHRGPVPVRSRRGEHVH